MSLTDSGRQLELSLPREERIRRRAEELYRLRGSEPGSALDDWLLAEREIVDAEEQAIDEALKQTFPASDTHAVSSLPAGVPQRQSAGSERRRSPTAKAK